MTVEFEGSTAGTLGLFGHEPSGASGVGSAAPDADAAALAGRLGDTVRLGTSSWYFPGWAGEVWDRQYTRQQLSHGGLPAYARHPLLRTVSLDRTFYQTLTATAYAGYAAQVPAGFRFVVKAPAVITDARGRGGGGEPAGMNPRFLDADHARRICVDPAERGLGDRLGALVFQLSPLPAAWRPAIDARIDALHAMLSALAGATSRDTVLAIEVRDREWLTRRFIAALRDTGATYCLGIHPRLPSVDRQLPLLRALWPGPFVCRWNLNACHGAAGYERARARYAPFDRLVDEDPATRQTLARVIAGTAGIDAPVFVTINNKAEGSAPWSVRALARAVVAQQR